MIGALLDTNVLLDVLLDRAPHAAASSAALDLAAEGRIVAWVSGHSVATVFYVLERRVGATVARKLLGELMSGVEIASVGESVIRSALLSPLHDFEDAIVVAAATHASLDLIVTRNTADFEGSAVPVVTPLALVAAVRGGKQQQ